MKGYNKGGVRLSGPPAGVEAVKGDEG